MARLWACGCGALNRSTDEQCEACGKPSTEGKSVEQRHFANPAPMVHVPETHAPAKLPDYPAPKPGDEELIRAEMAKLHSASWWRNTQGTARLPDVDPVIRSQVERKGPTPLAELVETKMGELKGAPR